jgi:SAM-dependent methyltransferase
MYAEEKLSHNWLAKKNVNTKVGETLAGFSGTVIDLGCGTRPFEADILQHAREYIGLDWGNTLHGTHADVIADLNRPLPIADASADHVVTFEVIEHLAEPATMLHEAARILRSGGTLTLSAPFQWWIHEEPWDYQRFTRYGLDYQLHKAGFTDISIAPTSGFWSMWLLKFNYQSTRLIRGPSVLRMAIRAFLIPIWWLNQTVAPWFDRIWPEERETAGYFVTARKP